MDIQKDSVTGKFGARCLACGERAGLPEDFDVVDNLTVPNALACMECGYLWFEAFNEEIAQAWFAAGFLTAQREAESS